METKREMRVAYLDDYDSDDTDDGDGRKMDPMKIEEQRLSQQMSQLSASQETTMKKRPTEVETSTATASKKMKTDETSSEDHLPFYLSTKNKLFDQRMNAILQKSATSINLEDLRRIAHLVHNVALTKLFISLWQTYLNSGTGDWIFPNEQQKPKSSVESPKIWPSALKKMMIHKGVTPAQNEAEIAPASCLTFAQNYLRQLNSEADQFQAQLINRKRRLLVITTDINQAIERFVHEQYINQIGLQIQAKIATVEYDYRDRVIELEYLQLKPNDYQVKSLCDDCYCSCSYSLFSTSYVSFNNWLKLNVNNRAVNVKSIC